MERAAAELRMATQTLLGGPRDDVWLNSWLGLLGSESWQVRALAVASGAQLPVAQRNYDRLLNQLESDNAGLRNSIISLLLTWGPSATASVVHYYAGASSRVRKFLLDGLRNGSPESVEPFLRQIWDESDVSLRVSILEAAMALGPAMAHDFVVHHQANLTDTSLRLAALECVRQYAAHWHESELLRFVRDMAHDEATHRSLILLMAACSAQTGVHLLSHLIPAIRSPRRMRELLDTLARHLGHSPAALAAAQTMPGSLWQTVDAYASALPALIAFARSGEIVGEPATWLDAETDVHVGHIVLARASRVQLVALLAQTPHAEVAVMAFEALYRHDADHAVQLIHARLAQHPDQAELLLAGLARVSPGRVFQWVEHALGAGIELPTALGHIELNLSAPEQTGAQATILRAAGLVRRDSDWTVVLRLARAASFPEPPAFALMALRSPQETIRAQALALLAAIPGCDVEPYVRTALLDESDLVFRGALDILVTYRKSYSHEVTEELWQRTQGWQQWAVFRALERLSTNPCDLLERGFDSQYPPIVLDTLQIAMRCDSTACIDAVAICLHHTDPAIVARAIDWCRQHKHPLPQPMVNRRLLDQSTTVRLALWSYLEAQGTMSVDMPLLQTAIERESDPHLFIRISRMVGGRLA